MSACIVVDRPESFLTERVAALPQGRATIVCLRYSMAQYYLPESPSIDLLAAVSLSSAGLESVLLVEASTHAEQALSSIKSFSQMQDVATTLECPCFRVSEALALKPVYIAKPWGQEIWYTGIEARGQSEVTDGRFSIPLPWLLSLLPDFWVAGHERHINLLKILDPLPEEVFGDLYFELHEEKQEVYVVTSVDSSAWPDGVGGIHIGFDPLVRQEYTSEQDFIAAFGGAVKRYEAVRREIDAVIDCRREAQGVALNQPVSAKQLKQWVASVDQDLQTREVEFRRVMDRFKGMRPLAVGDVLSVPCFTPHSLLHGVRTIEFQTPVYERQIVSFAQKVLTQENWDTDRALACMQVGVFPEKSLQLISQTDLVMVEEVVSFSDFDVWRVTLEPAAEWLLPDIVSYVLAIGVSGIVCVGETFLAGEEAALIPAGLEKKKVCNHSTAGAVALLALPKISEQVCYK